MARKNVRQFLEKRQRRFSKGKPPKRKAFLAVVVVVGPTKKRMKA